MISRSLFKSTDTYTQLKHVISRLCFIIYPHTHFNAFYLFFFSFLWIFLGVDVNQSGEIDKKDFELAIEKVCALRSWPAGHPKNVETYDTMIKIWEGLRSKADKDNDGQVSLIYFLSVFFLDYLTFMIIILNYNIPF